MSQLPQWGGEAQEQGPEPTVRVLGARPDGDTKFITAQTTPPMQVATLRGLVAGVAMALLTGALDALTSHQVGYSWGDSIESGLLVALPVLITLVSAFAGYGAIDQFRARKV